MGPTGKTSALLGTVPPQMSRVLHGTEVTEHDRGSQDPLVLKGQLSGAVLLRVILAAVAPTKANREFFQLLFKMLNFITETLAVSRKELVVW